MLFLFYVLIGIGIEDRVDQYEENKLSFFEKLTVVVGWPVLIGQIIADYAISRDHKLIKTFVKD